MDQPDTRGRPTGEPTKTELTWPGKYDDSGQIARPRLEPLPFQVIERISEGRAAREAREERRHQSTLFETYEGKEGDAFETGWTNKLIWGDNLVVTSSLRARFAGKIDLIYIDPPFASGSDFRFQAEIGEEGTQLTKEQSIIEEKAYRDTWGRGLGSYLSMMKDRLELMRELLSPTGTIFVHCDWSAGHYLKLVLDEVFGIDNFRNEVIWFYTNKLGTGGNTFDKHHDILLVYVKGSKWTHNPLMRAVKNQKMQPVTKKIDGERVWLRDESGNRVYAMGRAETKIGDVWEVPYINPVASERLGYPTQKPEALLENVIQSASNPGDLVADFFCGSGTTLAVAERLGRRWIGADMSRWAIHVTRKRLLETANCKPFEVLNVGRYERQYWQETTFGKKQAIGQLVSDYIAFMLKLYQAQPVAGFSFVFGKRGAALVHVGSVDAPVTIHDISGAIEECKKARMAELHVLGWEWEMGLYDLMVEEAKRHGVKLLMLQIPREVMERQAVDKGDVRFFELAYLEVKILPQKKQGLQVQLKDFVISNTELIPEDVRSKVKKWSDFVDYWAVDWDFQEDKFVQGFVAYRTKENRALSLESAIHQYPQAGKYRVVVKVIDIFGNDTSQVFDVEVK